MSDQSKADVFGDTYSSNYDSLYSEKDYAEECRLVAALMARHGVTSPGELLDLGCGTGRHLVEFAEAGWQVTGVDRSSAMLSIANERVEQRVIKASLFEGDVRSWLSDDKFDAVCCLFAVLGYQITNSDLSNTLRSVRSNLKIGGLFVADFWYGPAVLTERPSERIKSVMTPEGVEIIRIATPNLDTASHTNTTTYRLLSISGTEVIQDVIEHHTVRYIFPQELNMLLADSGFELLELVSFEDFESTPDETTWNVVCVARAI